ncbi:hypothetical protein [Limnochorda pilosa]|uniref:Uncharacterized protein n=1 Tax=Limnochorda pilosa TaxID=1555112 RepID=A0A0K2SNL5_LIMPI|nr:hypothetical protein [Limnochorda pilosa]BAS28686.1 hypothetical protein LIP_2857 [Limnochorda pilosa]
MGSTPSRETRLAEEQALLLLERVIDGPREGLQALYAFLVQYPEAARLVAVEAARRAHDLAGEVRLLKRFR